MTVQPDFLTTAGPIIGTVGGLIGIIGGTLSILDHLPKRAKLSTTYSFASVAEPGNTITVANLSSTPVLVMHWDLQWQKRWPIWKPEVERISSAEFDATPVTTIPAHGSFTFHFRGADHFNFGAKFAPKGRLFLLLYLAGSISKPRRLMIYDPAK